MLLNGWSSTTAGALVTIGGFHERLHRAGQPSRDPIAIVDWNTSQELLHDLGRGLQPTFRRSPYNNGKMLEWDCGGEPLRGSIANGEGESTSLILNRDLDRQL